MNFIDLIEISTIYQSDRMLIFNDMVIDKRLDKGLLIMELIDKCAQNYPYYTTVGSFKQASDRFFRKWKYQIGKLLDTMEFDYNPIWNKDVRIQENHNSERNREESVGDEYSEHRDTTENGTNTHDVSPYDSGDYVHEYKNTDNNSINTGIGSSRDIGTDENETFGEETVRVEQGNQGVTTTQQMIREERELMEFNIYAWISDKYQDELFMKVW